MLIKNTFYYLFIIIILLLSLVIDRQSVIIEQMDTAKAQTSDYIDLTALPGSCQLVDACTSELIERGEYNAYEYEEGGLIPAWNCQPDCPLAAQAVNPFNPLNYTQPTES